MPNLDEIAQYGEAVVRWADGPGEPFLRGTPTTADVPTRPEAAHIVRLTLARHVGAFGMRRPGGPVVAFPKLGDHDVHWNVGDGPDQDRQTALVLAGLLAAAVPYVWMSELRHAALAQQSLPAHRIENLGLPHNPMCWLWDRVIIVPEDVRSAYGLNEGAHSVATLVWGDRQHGEGSLFTATFLLDLNSDPQRILILSTLAAVCGSRHPDHTPEDYETYAKMLAFIRSPYIPKETRTANRGFRRRAERASSPAELTAPIHFVTLRRPEHNESENEGRSHAYSVRWIVSGHFRNQWYQSTQSHQLIWVDPHWKGREDAPLSPRAYKVSR